MEKYKISVMYTRVSTNMQDERGSKETQKTLIQEYASKNGYNIIAEFTDTDHGDKADRTGITTLKEYLRVNSSVKYVLVSHSDRFTRDFQAGMKDLFFLDNLGIKLISIKEGEIQVSGTWDSIPSILRLIGAQEDKKKIVSKIIDAAYEYCQTNRYLGGSLLPWFKIESGVINGKKCKVIVKNEDSWNFYRSVFLDIIRTRSIKATAKEHSLNHITVAQWLKKPEIHGYRTYGKKGKIDKNHTVGYRKNFYISDKPILPALLTEEEYSAIIDIHNHNRGKYRKNIKIYLYSNNLRCSCGGRFEGEKTKGKSGKYFYYYKCHLCKKRIPVLKAEKAISDAILQDKSLKMLNDCEFRLADLYSEVDDLKVILDNCVNSEKKVLELVAEGLTSLEVSKATLTKLKKDKERIIKNINDKMTLIAEEEKKEISEDNIRMLQELMQFQDTDDDEYREKLKEIINLIIRKVIFTSYDDIRIFF